MKKRKNVLVCIDRDGTIGYDNRYHLGHQRNWKSKVRLMDNVVKGLKKLRKIDCKIYILTNQTGVAIKNFPLLTEERAREVCRYVMDRLEDKGVGLDGFEVCGKANMKYVNRKKREGVDYKFDKKLVGDFSCIKPKIGMVRSALNKEGWNLDDTRVYFIGDRLVDVQCGINAGGYGILVPFANRPEEVEKVRKMKGKKYVAKDFVDACGFVVDREK